MKQCLGYGFTESGSRHFAELGSHPDPYPDKVLLQTNILNKKIDISVLFFKHVSIAWIRIRIPNPYADPLNHVNPNRDPKYWSEDCFLITLKIEKSLFGFYMLKVHLIPVLVI
jgi:hypothetical protein